MSRKPAKCFSFTWKIANFPNCSQQNSEEIVSPSFMAECLGGSRWYLELYPRGSNKESIDFISCYLVREEDCSFNGNITVDCTLQVIRFGGEIIKSFQKKNITFDQGGCSGCEKFFEFNKIVNYLKKQNEDTLTIRCMISLGTEMKMATACVVHSKIISDRYNFKWNVKYSDSNLSVEERVFILGELQFKISLGVHENNLTAYVSLIECNYAVPCLVVCQASFLNQRGVPESAFHGNHLFRSENDIWYLAPFIAIEELDNSENIYMTDEMFVMLFDFSCSNDVLSETIPSYTYNTLTVDSLSVLQSDFRELFNSKKHTDVILRTDNQDLPVHKTVLIARSPVFSTMFDQNMTEKQTGIVDIVDVDVETMKSFLEYLYTGSVEILNYESAVKLFSVAEKYQVQLLIDECYTFLLTVLSKKNVCELIYIADIVNHACLKQAAMDYIAVHTKEILISPEWSRWAEKNLKLTSEIFFHIASKCDITLKKPTSPKMV